ncbi:Golgi to ER traffic 4 homolog [Olea europaea subsp. europaea]|uniref:Golgi to ER traffic 4 homolog n=1 Tax=Olea europaea subsp. europaea TaxID=158383 RepID=A0A8S0QV39_OLEEU|nr:Golgi to ER traffic 4 homolog [Olea europaea subsp. europaea]
MFRERAKRVLLSSAKENIENIKKAVDEGNHYGAQQMYKSFSVRYIAAKRYLDALNILQSGACVQLENGQLTCGAELVVLFVEALVKGKFPYDDDIVDRIMKIYKKFPRVLVPQHLDTADDDDMQQLQEAFGAATTRVESCSSFLKTAIKWFIEFGAYRNGSPELQSYHFVRGKNPKKFASTLVNFMGKCYPGEDDLAIARAVLMYLSLGNLRDANILIDEMKKQVQSEEIEFPPTELMQLTNYLLLTLQRDALPLFNMLRQRYSF